MIRFASTLTLAGALTLALVPATPALADEVSDSIRAALEAYEAGDVTLAKEELDYAGQLLSQMKAEGLSAFLPTPMDGWSREDGETQALGAAMMGGGLTASATYTRAGERVEVSLMADNPMVTAMAGMFSSTAMMGAMGTLKRINGQKAVLTNDGELQALVNNRILVQVTGSGSTADKEAYFAAIDMDGLKDF